ncbi:uracil-DNA glycosylase-like protein, partial [Mycena rosella]
MKEEDISDDPAITLNEFRSSLSQFSFSSDSKPELRRSPRKPAIRASPYGSPTKRQASESGSSQRDDKVAASSSRERSPKKQKRSYAPPELYSHLRELQDHLKQDLDVIFCGIKSRTFSLIARPAKLGSSPGKRSAEIGHHFGNPTNHFWWCVKACVRGTALKKKSLRGRCLHRSGFTDTQISPQEDFTLPDRFSLGLTNLIDRPTTEQTELSREEQVAGVPFFLAKIARYRPRIVCFVGLGIAKVVESSLKVTLSNGAKSWGLRPYKMVHSDPSAFPETLFFAAPSSSGLVTQFQRPEKARIFGELRDIVQNLKAGNLSTTDMIVIPPEQIAQIPAPSAALGMFLFPAQGSSSDAAGEEKHTGD